MAGGSTAYAYADTYSNAHTHRNDLADSSGSARPARRRPMSMRALIIVSGTLLLAIGVACGPEPYPTATQYPTATPYPGWNAPTPTPYPTATAYPTSTPYAGEATPTPTARPRPTATATPTPRPHRQASTNDDLLSWIGRAQPVVNRVAGQAEQGIPPSASDCTALRRILQEGLALEARAFNDPEVSVPAYSNLLDVTNGLQVMIDAAVAGGFC